MIRRVAASLLLASTLSPVRGALGQADGRSVADWPLWLKDAAEPLPHPPTDPNFELAGALRINRDRFGGNRPSLYWTQSALDLIVKYQLNPLRAARILALVHAAMHDALVRGVKSGGDERVAWVAVHRAASLVLAYMLPYEPAERFEALGLGAAVTVAGTDHEKARVMWALGYEVARDAFARARSDGADRVWAPDRRPPPAPGQWRPTPPLNAANPLEPLAGEWRTWVIADGGAVEPPAPVLYGSDRFWQEVEEVKRIAGALTAAQKAVAESWNLDRGTITPAGVWKLKAMTLVKERKLAPSVTTRTFAALNIAMMDAFIACWHAKYKWWTIRPISIIRERHDPNFLSHLLTPPFPSYVSGHASDSGAAEMVLSHAFPEKAAWLRAEAQEAAESRLLGGIHFRSDNDAGLELGREIGRRVVQRVFGDSPQRH